MEDYNQQDAKRVLEYIYRNYGKTVFQEKGKARAYFNDLAPQLSKDRNMLKVLDEIGVLQDLCSVNSDDRDRQKKALRIAEEKVTKNTPLDDKYVISFFQTLSEVFGWKYQSFLADRTNELLVQQENPPKEPEPVIIKKSKTAPATPVDPYQTPPMMPNQKKQPPVGKTPKKKSPGWFVVLVLLIVVGAFSLGKSSQSSGKTLPESPTASISEKTPVIESGIESEAETEPADTAKKELSQEAKFPIVSETTSDEVLNPNETYQKIFVEASGSSAQLRLMTYREGEWVQELSTTAAIGSNGITYNKTEGDHMTPAGTFPLAFVFSDIAQDTKMPFVRIDDNSVWVCDPNSSFYNTLQSKHNPLRDWSDNKGSTEKMYVKFSKKSSSACIYFEFNGDGQTQYSAENYNGGSALFLDGVGANGNMYSGYGDIKIAGNDMNKLLKLLDPSMNPTITIEPA